MINRRCFLSHVLVGGSIAQPVGRCRAFETPGAIGQHAEGSQHVRIDSAEQFVIQGARGLKWILIRLRTNQGIEGIGECWPWFQRGVIDRVRTVTEAVQGANPLDAIALRQRLSRLGTGLAWRTALSGVEIAIWDILGQTYGVPIHTLLGGATRNRIPLYANHGMFVPNADTLEARIARIVAAKDAGFTAVKWDPTTPYGPRGHKDIAAVVNEIAAVRRAVGPDFVLGIDAHNNLSLPGALALAPQLDRFKLMFFEAPVLWPNNDQAGVNRPKALRQVAAKTKTPIAIGEWLYDPQEAARLMQTTPIRVIQPEISQVGGIRDMWNLSTFAQMQQVRVAAHHWTGPILALATSHVSAAIPNLLRQEYAAALSNDSWEYDLVEPPLQIEKGQMVVTNRPGLGAKLNEKLVRQRFP